MKRSRSNKRTWWIWILLLLLVLLATFLIGAYYESNEYFGNLHEESYREESLSGTTLTIHVVFPQRIAYDAATPERLTLWITDTSNTYKDRITVSLLSVNDLMLSVDKEDPQWSSTLSVSVLPNGAPKKILVQPFTSSDQVDIYQVLELQLPDFSKISLAPISIKHETYTLAQKRFVFSKVWEQISIPIGILVAVIGWLISQNDQSRQNQRERVISRLTELKNFPDKISPEFIEELKAAHEESSHWDSDLQFDLIELEQEALDDGFEYLGKYIDGKRRGDKKAAVAALFNLWDKTGIISREVVISGLQSIGSFQDIHEYSITPKNLAIFRDYRLQNLVKPLYTLENFPKEDQFKNDPFWNMFNLQIDESYRAWLIQEKLLMELANEQFIFPFADVQSPYFGGGILLRQSWLPPQNWEFIGSARHTVITAKSTWDLQAGLYSYLSNVQANTLDKTFFVQIQLGRQTLNYGVDFVLDALADEWITLLNTRNPLVLFEMPEHKQIALIRFLTWAAGSEHDLRAWLLQSARDGSAESKHLAKSLELMRKRIMELSSKNSAPQPSDREKKAWLSLRPEGLTQTHLIVLCSHMFGIESETKRSVSTKQSQALVEQATLMSSLGIYLKIFSVDKDLPQYLSTVFYELKLMWTVEQLSQISKQRVSYCSSQKIGGLDELVWPPSADSIDKRVSSESGGSMKNLVSRGSLHLLKFAREQNSNHV